MGSLEDKIKGIQLRTTRANPNADEIVVRVKDVVTLIDSMRADWKKKVEGMKNNDSYIVEEYEFEAFWKGYEQACDDLLKEV